LLSTFSRYKLEKSLEFFFCSLSVLTQVSPTIFFNSVDFPVPALFNKDRQI